MLHLIFFSKTVLFNAIQFIMYVAKIISKKLNNFERHLNGSHIIFVVNIIEKNNVLIGTLLYVGSTLSEEYRSK